MYTRDVSLKFIMVCIKLGHSVLHVHAMLQLVQVKGNMLPGVLISQELEKAVQVVDNNTPRKAAS